MSKLSGLQIRVFLDVLGSMNKIICPIVYDYNAIVNEYTHNGKRLLPELTNYEDLSADECNIDFIYWTNEHWSYGEGTIETGKIPTRWLHIDAEIWQKELRAELETKLAEAKKLEDTAEIRKLAKLEKKKAATEKRELALLAKLAKKYNYHRGPMA